MVWIFVSPTLPNSQVEFVMPSMMLHSNPGAGEDSWESLGLQGDPKPVHPKGNQSWTFIGRTDAEAEVPILWPPDVKSQLIGKDPGARKDWGQEERWVAEDEMVRWHHWLNGHESEQTLGIMKDREAWHAAVHGVTKSRTWLSNWRKTMVRY